MGRIAPHPAVFVRVANKELTGYGKQKSASTAENTKSGEARYPHPRALSDEIQNKGLIKLDCCK
jgi:hypothetical protein